MDSLKLNNLYQHFLQCKSVSTDSRQIIPGSIFFALKGENFNGNLFAVKAIESGASMAVVDDDSLHDHPGLFKVPDVLESLQQLAMLHRRKMKARVIAITGSNGKTTTKELVYVVLKSVYQVIATQGNLNNQIGVPLTLLRILPETEFAVIEMGANHVGEIAALCSIASPGFGMITNIGKAHLEGFGGIEGVVRAKTELYKAIENIKGVLFVNQQDALLMQHSEGIIRATYGKQSSTSLINGQLLSSNPLLSIEWNETGDRRRRGRHRPRYFL
ncbi:MAG: Mur ligase family protein [Bacteroidales bacterium]|nr:Mur ligase family protein [Bacteroidales bacterium]